MSFFDIPPNTDPDITENILTPGSMKRCQVITTWEPTHDHDHPPPPTQQRTFMSATAAGEWIQSITPTHRSTGSPKQLALKRASDLKVPPETFSFFTPTHTIQPLEEADVHPHRTNPNARPTGSGNRNSAPDRESVPNRPAETNPGERFPLSSVLSDAEIAFLSGGSDAPDDGEEV